MTSTDTSKKDPAIDDPKPDVGPSPDDNAREHESSPSDPIKVEVVPPMLPPIIDPPPPLVDSHDLEDLRNTLNRGTNVGVADLSAREPLYNVVSISDASFLDARLRVDNDRKSFIFMKFVDVQTLISSDYGGNSFRGSAPIHPAVIKRIEDMTNPSKMMILTSSFIEDGYLDKTITGVFPNNFISNAGNKEYVYPVETGKHISAAEMLEIVCDYTAAYFHKSTTLTDDIHTIPYSITTANLPSNPQDDSDSGFYALSMLKSPDVGDFMFQWFIQSGIEAQTGKQSKLTVTNSRGLPRAYVNGTSKLDALSADGKNMMIRRTINAFGQYRAYFEIIKYLVGDTVAVHLKEETIIGFESFPFMRLTQRDIMYAHYALLALPHGRMKLRSLLDQSCADVFAQRFQIMSDYNLGSYATGAEPKSAQSAFFGALSKATSLPRVAQFTAANLSHWNFNFEFTSSSTQNADADIFIRLLAVAIICKRYPNMLNSSGKNSIARVMHSAFLTIDQVRTQAFIDTNGWAGPGTQTVPQARIDRDAIPSYFNPVAYARHPNNYIRNYLAAVNAKATFDYIIPPPPEGLPYHGPVTVQLPAEPSSAPTNVAASSYLHRVVETIYIMLLKREIKTSSIIAKDITALRTSVAKMVTVATAVDGPLAEISRIICHSPVYIPINQGKLDADVEIALHDVTDEQNLSGSDLVTRSTITIDLVEVAAIFGRLVIEDIEPSGTQPSMQIIPPHTGVKLYEAWHRLATEAILATEVQQHANDFVGYLGAQTDANGLIQRNGLIPMITSNRNLTAKYVLDRAIYHIAKAYDVDVDWFEGANRTRIVNPSIVYLVPDNRGFYNPARNPPANCSQMINNGVKLETLIDAERRIHYIRIVNAAMNGSHFPFVEGFYLHERDVVSYGIDVYIPPPNEVIMDLTTFESLITIIPTGPTGNTIVFRYQNIDYISNFPQLTITISQDELLLLKTLGVRSLLTLGVKNRDFVLHFTEQVLILEYEYVSRIYEHPKDVEYDFLESCLNLGRATLLRRKIPITVMTECLYGYFARPSPYLLKFEMLPTMTHEPMFGPWVLHAGGQLNVLNTPDPEYFSLCAYADVQLDDQGQAVVDTQPQQTMAYELVMTSPLVQSVPSLDYSSIIPLL